MQRISVSLDGDTYETLKARAGQDRRSVSGTAALIITQRLAQTTHPLDSAPLTPEPPVSTTGKTTGGLCPGWKPRPGTARCFNCGRSRSVHPEFVA